MVEGDSKLEWELYSRRAALGITQAQLAARSGVRVSVIARIEQGRAKVLYAGEIERLANALGVLVEALLPEHRPTGRRNQYVKVG